MRTALTFATAIAFVVAAPAWAQHHDEQQHGGQQQHGDVQRPPEQQHGGMQRPAEPQRGEQHPGEPVHNQPRANQGRIPQPPPQRASRAKPEPERKAGGRVNSTPHVNNEHWYGLDKPNDKRYRVNRPFEHGRFEHFGPSYRYNVERFDPDRHRFWLPGGFFFEIASWDWALAADWCWNCGGEDFVVYVDPDHPGWYLLYNMHTGAYIHVQYMGM